jgi:tRNA U34 2-thiouridine synthase MnmA/TrmU
MKPGMRGKWFVARKLPGNDILIVPRADHPSLQCTQLWSDAFHWIAGHPPEVEGKELFAQVRHRMAPVPAHVKLDGDR